MPSKTIGFKHSGWSPTITCLVCGSNVELTRVVLIPGLYDLSALLLISDYLGSLGILRTTQHVNDTIRTVTRTRTPTSMQRIKQSVSLVSMQQKIQMH
jgi:hypothetical protein